MASIPQEEFFTIGTLHGFSAPTEVKVDDLNGSI